MDSLDNPQNFQNSSIVQKSSKTGIFSNKRLLVIKQGYLYYFSNVPKGYKLHVPNVLTTFTDLPKSSIQIRTIIDIRLESNKSSSLIIKFYLKDMIDREDIRKSIDSQLFNAPQKKNSNQNDEWKFTFTTVLQCRLWYNALIKLRQHFQKLENHFKDFITNFNPKKNDNTQIKAQRSTTDKNIYNVMVSKPKNQIIKQQYRNTQPIKFNASKFMTPNYQKQSSSQEKQSKLSQSKSINLLNKNSTVSILETQSLRNQEQQLNNIQSPKIKQQKIQPQQPSNLYIQNKNKGEQLKHSNLKQSQLIQPINEQDQIKINQIEDQIRLQVQQQIRKQINYQKQIQIRKYKQEMLQKQRKIKQLQNQIFKNQLINQQKQKQIQEDKKILQRKIQQQQEKLEQYKRNVQQKFNQIQIKNNSIIKKTQSNSQINRIDINSQNNSNKYPITHQFIQNQYYDDTSIKKQYKNQNQTINKAIQSQSKKINESNKKQKQSSSMKVIQMNQFSVQTDQQDFDNQDQPQLNFSKQSLTQNSFFSQNILSYRQNFKSIKKNQQQSNYNFQQDLKNYNYFTQQAKIFQNGISSKQKIKRQIKLLQFINSFKIAGQKFVLNYLNTNRPQQCKEFENGMFNIEIACAPGKIVKIGGQNKLIYSNKVHQKLKRKYKIYQKLQNQIFKQLKKKNKFLLRVPLCILIEYKGYTILVKLQLTTHNEIILNSQKYLKNILSSQHHNKIQLNRIYSINNEQIYMIKVIQQFKITDIQKNSRLFKDTNLLDLNQIQYCRSQNISINSDKLFKQINQGYLQVKQKQNYLKRIEILNFFRQLKKVYKSIQPFTEKEKEQGTKINQKSQFLQVFLKKPQQLISLIVSNITLNSIISIQQGYFYYLLQYFLGIRMNKPYFHNNNLNNKDYQIIPITRTFKFPQLITYQFVNKIQKYIKLNNIQSAQSTLNIYKQFVEYNAQTFLLQIKILLKKKQYKQAQQKIIRNKGTLQYHDVRNINLNVYLIQCYLFMGYQLQALKYIKNSIEYIEYMFKNQKNQYQINLYLLMAQTLLRTNNTNQAIKIYKKLIKQQKIEKYKILNSFAQILHLNIKYDINQSINFLLNFTQQLNNPIHKILLNKYLIKLYAKIHRYDKIKYYLHQTYQIALNTNFNQHTLEIYNLILNQTEIHQKYQKYSLFLQKTQHYLKYHKLKCIQFNTINLIHIIYNFQTLQKQIIKQELKNIINCKNTLQNQNTFQLLTWESINLFICQLINKNVNQNQINSIVCSINVKQVIEKIQKNIQQIQNQN